MPGHHDHAHDAAGLSDRRLVVAVGLNLLLTVAEVAGGILSGSLSLVADAVHNFNDCASLAIALVARRVARKPADRLRTFGYRRAEVIAALINLTVLIVVGLYLVYEAFERLVAPREIEGWTVIAVALVALAVDVVTALLLMSMSRGGLNLRAAFVHNVSDALGSLAVIVVGVGALYGSAYVLDVAVTLLIAAYILWQSVSMIRKAIHLLMESVPTDIDLHEVVQQMTRVPGVRDVHHVHIWQLDEEHRALEAHVVIAQESVDEMIAVKRALKSLLADRHGVAHSTLEFEFEDEHDGSDHAFETIAPH